ncbi:MAG TPA: hypothetical protein ENJ95_23615, partial [Bacteroidetes bacterium]|nr:hypothetical protein [Bacteroidota bacterium]
SKYKQFFKTLKAGTGGNDAPVKKMFITGVSPLAMYDVTSGYNIGSNITTRLPFNDILGVTRDELDAMLDHFNLSDKREMIRDRMDKWYDGYKFNENIGHTIYNTDMVLYYLNSMITENMEPRELIDINVRSDYRKIRFLIETDKKLNGNFSVLEKILTVGHVELLKIADSFSAFEIRSRNNFISLLFYLGLISIEKYETGLLTLGIPNQTIQKILAGFIQKALKEQGLLDINLDEFNLLVHRFAYFQKLDVFDYLAKQLEKNSKIRDYIAGEHFVKGFLIAYLSLNQLFEVSTEKEVTKGYVDIYLKPVTTDIPYGGVIEIKYIGRKEFTEALLEQTMAGARKQIQKYKAPENFTKVILVFNGWELVLAEEWNGDGEDG